MNNISKEIESILPSITSLRQELHRHPELSFNEVYTAKRIVSELDSIPGLLIESEIAKTGVLATLGAEKRGPCIALRCELDALPIHEQSGVEYESSFSGKMHACGHDGHMAALVGTVRILAKYQEQFPGPIKFIFQPAEEHGGGAKHMCDAGVLKNPKVDTILAFHCNPRLPLNTIGICDGPTMASCDSLRISVRGKGGHAAAPHAACDPIHVAAQLIVSLQGIVSRSIDPIDALVITVSKFHAGGQISPDQAPNIIPDTAELEGTIRALSPDVRIDAHKHIVAIAQNTARAFGAEAEIEITEGYPALINNSEASALALKAAKGISPAQSILHPIPPKLSAEDFAFYTEYTKAAMWFLGISPPGTSNYPYLHNSQFNFVDDALFQAVRMHCACVQRFFEA